jgi:3-deoxy-manno-octulosonate cytidylyltransferase (CMP-KDO synthetase)
VSSDFHVIIPARFSASRLPGKPLADIGGRPLIQWVWECARASGAASVIVATDDARIETVAAGFGADVALTSAQHASGTDRIAEVVRTRGLGADEIIVNLQGDEPLMPPQVLSDAAAALDERPHVDIATAAAPITSLDEFLDPSCVKALRAHDGSALYFSKGRPAAFGGALRHIGLYAYRVKSLLRFAGWPAAPLEITEKLEQLRALEYGMRIHVLVLGEAPPAGVDTHEDLERVRAGLRHR